MAKAGGCSHAAAAALALLSILLGATTACASPGDNVHSAASVVAAFRAEGVNLETVPKARLNVGGSDPRPPNAFDAVHSGTPKRVDCGPNCGAASIRVFNVFVFVFVFVYVYRSSDDATKARRDDARRVIREHNIRAHNVLVQYLDAPPAEWLAKVRRALARLR